ncbi:hypothetical protein AS156_03470 [Bradyrhizobium macuxiense]|uniref:Uncharacterized protein n=1 Tax=Bradyrhizobium macuxiense TaxID=1755647 RepID=A0A120FPI9_9BRAD|nr:hypothetical protein AS156_03470 [Bradyrhizobium macuxiense]
MILQYRLSSSQSKFLADTDLQLPLGGNAELPRTASHVRSRPPFAKRARQNRRRFWRASGEKASCEVLPIGADADAEARSINTDARPTIVATIVVVIVVVSPWTVVGFSASDDDAIAPAVPASSGIVTNEPSLLEQL